MVLNIRTPYDSSGSDSEEDAWPWEMVNDEDETTLLAASNTLSVPSNYIGDATQIKAVRESPQLETVDAQLSGGKAITIMAAAPAIEPPKKTDQKPVGSGDSGPTLQSLPASEEEEGEKSGSNLLESLSDMGFEKEQIEKAIGLLRLREKGAAKIDENSIIDEIERKTNDDDLPWDPFVEYSATTTVARNIGLFAEQLCSNVTDEWKQRFHVKAKCDGADNKAQTAHVTTRSKYAASVVDDMTVADSCEKADGKKSESHDLLESLSNMGFKKEQVEKAIEILRESRAAEMGETSIIETMGAQEMDLFRCRTQNAARSIGISAKELWSNVRIESRRFDVDLDKAKHGGAYAPAQTTHVTNEVNYASSSAKDPICLENEENFIAIL